MTRSIAIFWRDAFAFHAFIGSTSREVLEFFGAAAGPIDDCAFDAILFR